MLRKTLLILTTGIGLLYPSFAQFKKLTEIDKDLTSAYKKLLPSNTKNENSTSAFIFKQKLLKHLNSRLTFANDLDSLSKYITIKTSLDRRIKFYSWDDFTGGSWHNINCVAQFISDNNNLVLQNLSNSAAADSIDFADSEIFEIHQLFAKDILYLTFAWGSHGSGNQHAIVRAYTIKGRYLVANKIFANNSESLIIQYPRSQNLNLTFTASPIGFSYKEYEYNIDEGIYFPTGRTISLKLINGKFTAQ